MLQGTEQFKVHFLWCCPKLKYYSSWISEIKTGNDGYSFCGDRNRVNIWGISSLLKIDSVAVVRISGAIRIKLKKMSCATFKFTLIRLLNHSEPWNYKTKKLWSCCLTRTWLVHLVHGNVYYYLLHGSWLHQSHISALVHCILSFSHSGFDLWLLVPFIGIFPV